LLRILSKLRHDKYAGHKGREEDKSEVKKSRIKLSTFIVLIVVSILAVTKPSKVPIVAQLTYQHRPASKMTTITTLPEFPDILLYARWLSREKKDDLIQTLINNKVSTWPSESSRSYRAWFITM
jgi:hypothetical protein